MKLMSDASLKIALALPNGAATVMSDVIDIGTGAKDGLVELLLSMPALTTTQLPDGKTITYGVCWSDNADRSAAVIYISAGPVQTGAGGVGSAAATFQVALPSNAGRYVFFKATGSAASVTVELVV